MARKQKTVEIATAGRDKGKIFVVTEMPAVAAWHWGIKLLAVIRSLGATISEDAAKSGMAGVAQASGNITPAQLIEAMQDESLAAWWDCVRYQHDPEHAPQIIKQGVNCPIDEVLTCTELAWAVVTLHTGFFSTEKDSISDSPSQAKP